MGPVILVLFVFIGAIVLCIIGWGSLVSKSNEIEQLKKVIGQLDFSVKYRHKKSNRLYFVLRQKLVNSTNANDGQVMVCYTDKDRKKLYVREETEFDEKFEKKFEV